MSYSAYFIVFMAILSYYNTIVTNSSIKKLKENEAKPYDLDYTKRI